MKNTPTPGNSGLVDHLRRVNLRLAAISDHLLLAGETIDDDTRQSDRLDLIDIRIVINDSIKALSK